MNLIGNRIEVSSHAIFQIKKDLMQHQFSFFQNHSRQTPDFLWNPEQVFRYLKSTALVKAVNNAHEAYLRGGKKAANKFKKNLPCVTPSGRFTTRKSDRLLEHSGIICLDFDELNSPVEFRQKMSDDPHVLLAFLSPTLSGVKVWVKVTVEGKMHERAYRAAADHFARMYGMVADESGKDVSRLCYLSHDPDAHYNATALPLSVPIELPPPESKTPPSLFKNTFAYGIGDTLPEVTQEDAHAMLRVIKDAVERPLYDQWFRILNAIRSHFGDQIAKTMLEAYFPSEEEREYDKKFAHPCEQIGIGTLIYEATQYGFNWSLHLKKRTKINRNLKSLPELTLPEVEAPFPASALPLVVREVAEDLARVYQVPVSLPALVSIAVLSGSIGAAAEVFADHRGGTRLNLYVALGAERGCGKSGVATVLMKPLQEESDRLEKEWRSRDPKRKAHLELLKEQVKKNGASAEGISESDISRRTKLQEIIQKLEDELKYSPQLWMGDATSEALAKVLSKNGETNMCFSADAGDPIRMACGLFRKAGGDVEMYLKGWSGDSHAQDRILRDSVRLTRPCLTILWLVQGMLITELVNNPEAMERGFLARRLIIDTGATPQEVPENPASFQSELREQWNDLVKRILTLRGKINDNGKPIMINATREAVEVFRLFGNESVRLGRAEYMDIKGELTRWAENSIRVAGLLALIEGTDSVCEEQAKRAVEIVRWCGLEYLKFLSTARYERFVEEMKKLSEVIESAGGEIASGELQSNHGYRKERFDLAKKIVALFPNVFEMQTVKNESKAGAPKLVFRLKASQGKQ